MFDDWTYGIVAESTRNAQINQNHAQKRHSIVQNIARPHDLPVIDVAKLTPRRNSIPAAQKPAPRALSPPFSKLEKSHAFSAELWYTSPPPPATLPEPTLEADLASSFLHQLSHDAENLLSGLESTETRLQEIGDALHDLNLKSQSVLDRQKSISELESQLAQALETYDTLESATRALNRPGTRIVTSSTFPDLLTRLDKGLKFCQQHPDFKDMDLYEMRYSQCIARAHAMVLEHCTGVWRSTGAAISSKLGGASQVTVEALLWPKFQSDTTKIADILRTLPPSSQIVTELQRSFSAVRAQLLRAPLSKMVSPSFSATLSYLRDIISRERGLWVATFGGSRGFDEFSLVFTDPMYIELRGRIVHETNINELCEIIMLLQDDPSPVSKQVFQDAQNRLLFRADQVLENTLSLKITSKELRSPQFVYVSETLSLLSQLYQVMNQGIFQEFAHQSIRQCLVALRSTNAVELLGPIEGQLFHIHQLVALQHGIMEYDLTETSAPQVDFSGLASLLETVRTTPQTLLSFDKFVNSMPQVVDQLYDSIQELHAELQVVVQQFTGACTDELLDPIVKNDPRTAAHDTRVMRDNVPKVLDKVQHLAKKHVEDEKIVDALMDSVVDAFVESYKDYYHLVYHAGSPDQLEGVLDGDAMVGWLETLSRRDSRQAES